MTRSALARGLCEQEGWYGASGKPVLSSARVLLPKLADQLCLRLPEAESVDFDPHVPPALDFPDTQVASTLRDLGPVSLDLVSDAEDRCRWEAMVATHHPEGWHRPPNGIDLRGGCVSRMASVNFLVDCN